MKTALLAGLVTVGLSGCGGRLLQDVDAGDAATTDSATPYTGEWCDLDAGKLTGPAPGAVFCSTNPYTDAATYCKRSYSATSPWGCCTLNDFECCPLAAHMEDYGVAVSCCASASDCTACCAGIANSGP